MASAIASAATRSIPPPYTIPLGPRIRPPRLLPGTKATNTNPQPDEPPPAPGNVWVQGQWRNPGSNAARDQRVVQSTRAEKSLRHATHGMNIYAYSHMRTNQVVYSLTRVMQNTKILPQLLYHGKQTVPAALRRDLWRPYFSIHFPETPAGAEAGLKAYRRLRELSTQRQLSPPTDLIVATEADVQKAKDKYTPMDLRTRLKNKSVKNLPIKNQLLPQRLRARKLMNQKASSVADAAFVLGFMNQTISPAEEQDALIEGKAIKYQNLSSRAARRLNRIREKEAVKDAEIEARQATILPSEGRLGLTPHAARRIALEHGGAVSAPHKGVEYAVSNPEAIIHQKEATNKYLTSTTATQALLAGEQRPTKFNAEKFRSRYVKAWKEQNMDSAEGPSTEDVEIAVKQEQELVEARIAEHNARIAEAKSNVTDNQQNRNDISRTVQVLWADLRDATWAEQWSSNVYHGELESRAALKHERTLVRQKATIDEEGNEVPGQFKKVVVQGSTTPHVFGKSNQSGSYERPEQMSNKRQEWKDAKTSEWKDSKLEKSREVLNNIDLLQQQRQELLTKKLELQPEFDALKRFETRLKSSSLAQQRGLTAEDTAIQNLTEAEKYELRTSMAAIEDSIATNNNELLEMERNYPSLYGKISQLVEWRDDQDIYTQLLKHKDEIEDLQSAFDSEDSKASEKIQQIDLTLTTYADKYPELATVVSLESNLFTRLTENRERTSTIEERSADPNERADLQNKHRLLTMERTVSWDQRLNAIHRTLDQIEKLYEDTDIVDMLRQRVHAEKSGNTEAMETLNQELKSREDDKFSDLLGIEVAKGVEADVTEYDEGMREKGVEMPAPVQPKRGVWGRVMGLFGR